MTRRREVQRRLADLAEIRAILDAMRNLALLETRKLARFRAAHRRSLDTLARAVADVAAVHAPAPPAAAPLLVWILLGSERGFCGDLNEGLLQAWEQRSATDRGPFVAVGARLASRLEERHPEASPLSGPSVAEDVNGVIVRLAQTLRGLLRREPGKRLTLAVLHYDPERDGPQLARLELFPQPAQQPSAPVRLNLPAAELLPELAERHLLAQLQAALYASLAAENEQRLRHMDAAIRRLDEESDDLAAQRNRLRQEEITEEIEVLMLSAGRPRAD